MDACRVHLVGVGKVGQAWLDQLAERQRGVARDGAFLLVGASDRTGSILAPGGVAPEVVARWKRSGRPVRELPVRELPGAVARVGGDGPAVDAGSVDVVVDATDSAVPGQDVALERTLGWIDGGLRVVTAAKTALLAGSGELLNEPRRSFFACNAALGGTGRRLLSELDRLRRETTELICVPNATTTRVIETVERGGTIEDGIARCLSDGLLEADPTQDISGVDAALKLVIVANMIFERSWTLQDVALEAVGKLTEEAVHQARAVNATLRLVGRATRQGLSIAYEAVERDSPLAIASQQVLYAYQTAELEVRVGDGVGAAETAREMWVDLVGGGSRGVDAEVG